MISHHQEKPWLEDRVIVISGDVANPETQEIIDRMGMPYLVKPFDLDELLGLVVEVCSQTG